MMRPINTYINNTTYVAYLGI